jgi:hypothetical protein
MATQKEIFKASEVDRRFQRNKKFLNSLPGEDNEIVNLI